MLICSVSRRVIVIFVPLISANHHGTFVKRVIRSTKGSQLLNVVQPFQPVELLLDQAVGWSVNLIVWVTTAISAANFFFELFQKGCLKSNLQLLWYLQDNCVSHCAKENTSFHRRKRCLHAFSQKIMKCSKSIFFSFSLFILSKGTQNGICFDMFLTFNTILNTYINVTLIPNI